MKKIMIMAAVFCFIMGMGTSVMAETKKYEFIFEYEGLYMYSDVASKADTEKNYYVTQTFNARPPEEYPRTRYYSYYNGARVSNPLNLLYNDFNKHFESYTITNVKTGTGYRLYGQNVTGIGSTSSHVVGRWTP